MIYVHENEASEHVSCESVRFWQSYGSFKNFNHRIKMLLRAKTFKSNYLTSRKKTSQQFVMWWWFKMATTVEINSLTQEPIEPMRNLLENLLV